MFIAKWRHINETGVRLTNHSLESHKQLSGYTKEKNPGKLYTTFLILSKTHLIECCLK